MTQAAPAPPRRKVAIFVSHPIQYYAPWFRHLARSLDVEVFFAMRGGAAEQGAAGFGVEFAWDTPLLEGYSHRFLRNAAAQPSLQRFGGCDTPEVLSLFERERFDAAVVFGWNRKSSLQAIWAARRRGVPVLMRGDSQLQTRRSWQTRVAKFVPFRTLLPRFSGHLVVGRRNRDYLLYYGVPERKLFFVPHCVDTDFFADGAERALRDGAAHAIRRGLGVSPNAFLCGFVGKLIEKKQPLDLLRALRRTPPEAEVHAVFIGDGPLRGSLEALAAAAPGRVHFAGFRNQSELPAYYSALDCLVLPSDAGETWGLVVNEAAACGVPAIVSDAVGCAPDLIEAGRTGFIYELGRCDLLAERIEAMRQLRRTDAPAMQSALEGKTREYSLEAASLGLHRALAAVAHG